MNIFLIMVVLFFTAYIIMNNPDMAEYKHSVPEYVSTASKLCLVITIFIIGYVIEFLYRVCKHWYQYIKWKKENKIVVKYKWWGAWLK